MRWKRTEPWEMGMAERPAEDGPSSGFSAFYSYNENASEKCRRVHLPHSSVKLPRSEAVGHLALVDIRH